MGTANKQISTYSNVANKRIHNGFSASYATTATKCVNKGILQHVEFLEAKDRTVTTNPYYATPSNFGLGYMPTMKLVNNGYTTNQSILVSNVYNTTYSYDYSSLAYCAVRATTSINAYTSVTVTMGSRWPSAAEDPGHYSMFYKQLTGISTGLVKLEYTISMEGICGNSPTTQSSSGNPAMVGITNPTITVGVIVTDNYGQIIGQRTPISYGNGISNSFTDNFTFSASTSTINVYIIIPTVSFTFTAPQASTYAGVKFRATSNVISYASRYDLDTKCVQYQDINHPSGKKFTVYYGVWNNKGSNAKLNNLYVQIKKTSDSSWTTIGTAALPSSLNKSTTGSVTCTLPTTYDPTVQYDFRVTAGETNSKQQWYYRWGSQSSLTASGYSWTSCGKVKTGVCTNASGLNTHSAYSTLRNYDYSTTTSARGRSASMAALFCIE